MPKTSIIILVVAVVALAGVVVWQGVSQPKPSSALPATNQPAVNQEQQPQDETAGWSTYKNEQYGFEVKYPTDWIGEAAYDVPYGYATFTKYDPSQEKKVGFEGEETESAYIISVNVFDNLESVALKNHVLQESGGFVLEKDLVYTEVAGQQAVKYEVVSGYGSGPVVATCVAYKEKFYTFVYSGFAHPETHYKFIDTYNQILSTFKFLKYF